MRVGKRLQKILNLLVDKVGVVADVGTDHGILAFKILTQNKAKKLIATDISAPSLSKAIELKSQYKLGDEFDCVVGDGLKPLKNESQIDIVIIAGMGGNEIIKILNERPIELKVKRYIFQPMQDAEILRKYLIEAGYNILLDETVEDRNKFYSTIVCESGKAPKKAKLEEVVVGKTDRKNKGKDFCLWLEMEVEKQLSREQYLSGDKKKRLNILRKIKLENEEKNNL